MDSLVLLKIIANDNKPERTKDITDIAHIISVYFDLHDEIIYQEKSNVLDLYDTNDNDYLKLVSARIIGHHIGGILTDSFALRNHVIEILRKRAPIPYYHEIEDGILDSMGMSIN